MRVRTDDEFGRVYPALIQCGHLTKEYPRVNDHAVTDHWHHIRGQNATGQQVKGKFLIADDHGMAGVIAALVPNDIVNATAEEVCCLAFALVTPL